MQASLVQDNHQDQILPTDEQVDHFKTEGYLIVKNALSTDRLQKIWRAIEACNEKFDKLEKREKIFIKTRRNIKSIITQHDEFLELIHLNTTFPIIVRLLQHYNIQLLLSQLIENRPNKNDRAVGWHIDGGMPQPITEDGARVMQYLKVSYALTDVDHDDAGGLEVVPRSHKRQFIYSKFIKGEQYQGDYPDSKHLKMQAGDAVIFDQRLWHSASRNKTNKARSALYYGYGYAYIKPVDYISMPENILQKCSPIGRQLLGQRVSSFPSFSYYHPSEEDVPLKKWYLDHFGDSWLR